MDWNLWISCFLMFCMTGMKALDIHQPLSMINTARTSIVLDPFVSISAAPDLLGLQGQHVDFVTITFKRPYRAAATDWIGVFSPAIFNSSVCVQDKTVPNRDFYPLLCTAPIKYQYANFSSPGYVEDCEGSMKFRLINQRADFAFALFSGDIYQPVLLAVSNIITFAYRKFPAYPRLALGKLWNEVTITWTSGYDLLEATPLVVWGRQLKKDEFMSGAGTLSFTESDMCGPPARTVGWRNPGYIHTSYLKNLWANTKYFYRVGHLLQNESYVWGTEQFFSSPPYPGEDSVQRVLIFGDMGKVANVVLWLKQCLTCLQRTRPSSEHDWRQGTEQYVFIESCLASADRQRQPWLVFIAHRVLGYSSAAFYVAQGTLGEPMGRETFQDLWQKYKVDLAIFGHVHNYERTCPVYENICVSKEKIHFSGTFNATIHLVVGGAGASLTEFTPIEISWSIFRDFDHGFSKLTAFNHSALLFEYKRSSDGNVYDHFWITREYKDVLGCDVPKNCPLTTLAS